MSLGKYLALDKVTSFFNIIRQNGGIRASLYKLYRQDELKDGVLVGEDQFGNKYFENPRYFFSRNRWVEYSDKFNMDYDGSQVPAEWFGWLHYKTDLPLIRTQADLSINGWLNSLKIRQELLDNTLLIALQDQRLNRGFLHEKALFKMKMYK